MEKKTVPKDDTPCKYLSLITLDSVNIISKMYHPQTFLKECKYEIKKNKKENLTNDDFDTSSFDESDNESDNDESKKSSKKSDSDESSDESSD